MKKKIFLLPTISLLLSGCSLDDLAFWNNKSNTPNEQNNDNKEDKTPKDGDEGEKEKEEVVAVSSISLNKASLTLEKGSSEQLSYTIEPSNATNKNVRWSSTEPSIVSVNNGLINALSVGTASVSVISEDGEKKSSCEVSVIKKDEVVSVSSIQLNKTTLSLEESESEQLSYTITPSDATNQNVEWSTSDGTVANVDDNGLVKAINAGTATITVKTEDGNKTSSCQVTVTKKEVEVKTITASLVFNDKNYKGDTVSPYTDTIKIDDNISVTFSKGEGQNVPVCNKYNKVWSARMYPKNELYISSNGAPIKKVEFTFDTSRDSSSNPIESDPSGFSVDTWNGSSEEITFIAGGTSDYRCISAISVTYEGEHSPDEAINLGVKSISDVKKYIADHPVQKNSFGNGSNENVTVTIKGFALAKIDLVKTTSTYGLEVSKRGKVIMADETGSIGVATNISGDGTTFWGKVGDHVCEETSKYIVTGYISEVLSNPELIVTSYTWDKTLNISWSPSVLSKETIDLEGFYSKAVSLNYNCTGHAYGDVVTIKNLKCYYCEADGQGKRYYNFTDGERSLRVNAFNLSTISVGSIYDVTGIISMKNLSPIIVGFAITQSTDPIEISFDYESVAEDISITGLKKIHGSQEDTDKKYPEVIESFGKIYKTTGYLTAVEEDYKLYVGISDAFIDRDKLINGKFNAMANYGVALIKNEDFWNTTEEELYLYNPTYDDYLIENRTITIYYVVRQLQYQSNKPMWEILLLPDFVESLMPTE